MVCLVIRAAVIVAVLLTVGGAKAWAGMVGLDEWRSRPKGQHEQSYLFIRCAALYQGVFNYAGEDRLGSKSAKPNKRSVELNSLMALLLLLAVDGFHDTHVEQSES